MNPTVKQVTKVCYEMLPLQPLLHLIFELSQRRQTNACVPLSHTKTYQFLSSTLEKKTFVGKLPTFYLLIGLFYLLVFFISKSQKLSLTGSLDGLQLSTESIVHAV